MTSERGPEPPGWLRSVPLAHRGLHGDGVPENSLAAFEAAAAADVGVELDVQASRDGVPIVLHDPGLVRVAGRADRVADLDAAQLQQVELGDGQRLPTLVRALEVLRGVPVMVEIKKYPGQPPIEPALRDVLAAHVGPVCVASFHPGALRWFRRFAPEMTRVLTAGPLTGAPVPGPLRWSVRTLRWLRATRPHAVSYDLAGIDQPVVQSYRDDGGVVVTWTVDSEEDLQRARLYADNVIFESLPVEAVRTDRIER